MYEMYVTLKMTENDVPSGQLQSVQHMQHVAARGNRIQVRAH